MKLRYVLAAGIAIGYYMGVRTASDRPEPVGRLGSSVKMMQRSGAVNLAGRKSRALVDLGMERARDVVGARLSGIGSANGSGG
ncbi:MAG: hypothetical protein M1115_05125 [Actinobacteria bacterium]|nr:hypothetical protein [Actinomycetota bacterium]